MALNVLQAHAQAFLDLLDADDAPPALVVLNGKVPKDQTLPYALCYFRLRTPTGLEVPEKVSLEATSDVLDAWVYVHSIASTPMNALAVAGRARARLLGVTPVIAGRLCYPIQHDDSVPTSRDESTLVDVFDQVDIYKFTSQPG